MKLRLVRGGSASGAVGSTFRIGDLMDFSYTTNTFTRLGRAEPDNARLLRFLLLRKRQRNRKVPMLPGLAKLLEAVPEGQRTGWVANPLPIEYELKSQGDEWFTPAANDLKALIADYSNSTIARSMRRERNIGQTVAKRGWVWSATSMCSTVGTKSREFKLPDYVLRCTARSPHSVPRQRAAYQRTRKPDHREDWQGSQYRRSPSG